jgi:hypothetical protein
MNERQKSADKARARLAAALRENLKRRKAQARARAGAREADCPAADPLAADRPAAPHDSAGIGGDNRRG